MAKPEKKEDVRNSVDVAAIQSELLDDLTAEQPESKDSKSSFPKDFSASGSGKGGGGSDATIES